MVTLLLAMLASHLCAKNGVEMPAKWENGYVPFSDPKVGSLVMDPRILAISDLSYPNCVPVKFAPVSGDSNRDFQSIWVRLLDRDSATDLFLGEVVGFPVRMSSVARHDNVLFRFGTMLERLPSAVMVGDSYLAYPGELTRFGRAFVAGVAADRELYLGRNTVTLPDCFKKLREAVSLIDAKTRRKEAFHALYLLGRCHSEASQIDSAIAWFKSAMEVDSADPDAAMSLMAEYSVKYARSIVDRNVSLTIAVKAAMQELSDRIRRMDTPDRNFAAMLDQVYTCQVRAREKRKDPCNTLRYKR